MGQKAVLEAHVQFLEHQMEQPPKTKPQRTRIQRKASIGVQRYDSVSSNYKYVSYALDPRVNTQTAIAPPTNFSIIISYHQLKNFNTILRLLPKQSFSWLIFKFNSYQQFPYCQKQAPVTKVGYIALDTQILKVNLK